MSEVNDIKVAEEARWHPGCFFGGFAGLLLGCMGFFLSQFIPTLSFGPPAFESVARVMVVEGRPYPGSPYSAPPVMKNDSEERALARARLDVEVIKSAALLEEAMRIGKLSKRPSFRAGRGSLRDAVAVEQEGDLPIVRISVRSTRSDDARAGADAVTKAYIDLFKKRANKVVDEMKFITSEALDDVGNDLTVLETSLEEAKTGLSKTGHRRERLAELEKTVLSLETKAMGTEARLGSLESAIESSTSDAETQLILQRVLSLSEPPPSDLAIKGLKADVDAAKAELRAIVQLRDAEEARCKAAVKDEIRVANLTAAIERKRAMHRELIQRLKDIHLLGNYGSVTATVLSPASVATEVRGF